MEVTVATFRLLLGIALLGCILGPKLVGGAGTTPLTPVTPGVTPTSIMQQRVVPIATLVTGHPQASELAGLLAGYADVLQRDNSVITNTDQLRTANTRVFTLRFEPSLNPKIPGLADTMNKILADSVGLEVQPLDTSRSRSGITSTPRQDAVEAIKAMSWACKKGK
jgi:hypothetical protein